MNATASPTSPEIRSVDAGRGVDWWAQGWALFTKNPGMWVVMGLLTLIILIVLNVIPLGQLVAALLMPVFGAAWMLTARKVEAGGTIEPGDLFVVFNDAGVKDKLTPLLIVGALMAGATMLITGVFVMFGAGALMGLMAGGAMNSVGGVLAAAGAGMVGLLVSLLLLLLVTMAFWFAPALIVFRNTPPVEALKASFAACLKGFLPFLIYGVIGLVASIVASMLLGLGWLVLGPLSALTVYASYKDMFGE